MANFLSFLNGIPQVLQAISVSSGSVADGDKLVCTSSTGKIDSSLLPSFSSSPTLDKQSYLYQYCDFTNDFAPFGTSQNGYSDIGLSSRSYSDQPLHPGAAVLLIGKDANSLARIGSNLNALHLMSGFWSYQCAIRLRNIASIAGDVEYFFGFCDNVPMVNAARSVGIRFKPNEDGGKWQLASRDVPVSGTVFKADTGVTVTANTWYTLKLVVTPTVTPKAEAYINGVKVATLTQSIPVSGSTKTLGAVCYAIRPTVSTDITEYIMDVDYLELICMLTTSR